MKSLKMSFPPAMTFHDSPVLGLSGSLLQNSMRLKTLPTLEPRGQLSGRCWRGRGGEGMQGTDENNSRGEGSDPKPSPSLHRALAPSPRGQGLHPLHSLTPADATHPRPHQGPPHLLSLSEGLRWRGSPLTPSWPHCFTLQLSHPQPWAEQGRGPGS